MSKVSYFDIETEIASILTSDITLNGVNITVESVTELDAGSWVGIYLVGRDVPDGQPLANGTLMRYRLNFILWCWEYSLESITDAIQRRDDLVGRVEVALMKNRTLNNSVNYSFIEGGELQSAQIAETSGYIAGGEIILKADITFSTL